MAEVDPGTLPGRRYQVEPYPYGQWVVRDRELPAGDNRITVHQTRTQANNACAALNDEWYDRLAIYLAEIQRRRQVALQKAREDWGS